MIEIKKKTTVTNTFNVKMSLSEHLFNALKQLANTPCKCTRGYHCSQTGQVVEPKEPKEVAQLRGLINQAILESGNEAGYP